jgi:L-asparagine transporter-like permease
MNFNQRYYCIYALFICAFITPFKWQNIYGLYTFIVFLLFITILWLYQRKEPEAQKET